ncbi:MAG: hypothetical protein ABI947_05045 [Chloroflexota bacterium]
MEHDWARCEGILEALLEQMKIPDAIKVALEQVKAYLPTFEYYHPEVTWSRELLNLMESGQVIERPASFPVYGEGFPSPGSNGFIEALALVKSAIRHQHEPQVCIDLASGAIANSIGARRYEYWARKYPSDWDISLRLDAGEENLPPMESQYLRDPQVQKYTEDLWTLLANIIQDRLEV